MKKYIPAILVLITLLGFVHVTFAQRTVTEQQLKASSGVVTNNSNISASRKTRLMDLLLADCGSCHGMTMKGGLGPSLLAVDLKNKSDAMLFYTIREGRKNTPMPPWKPFMNDDEIRWMVKQLRQQTWKKELNEND